jgi:diguanylate cyclase (GGDEF)-like protein
MNQVRQKKRHQTILIVDDTPANLRLVSSVLTNQGYIVRCLTSGKMALVSAKANPPDLILLDVNMPDMSGYDVCRSLKSDPITANIPVIFISALDEVLDRIQGFVVGGADYILKPFQIAEVLARVETQLSLYQTQKQLLARNSQLQDQVSNQASVAEELQKNNHKLLELARLDSLTQVSNRRYFDAYLRMQWLELGEQQQPLALIMCGVDFFKDLNEYYGYYEGDNCLQKVAAAIQSVVDNPYALVARYGGAEFAVILPNSNANNAAYLAELMRIQINGLQIVHENSSVSKYVTISVGVMGFVPVVGASPAIMITGASYALDEAKYAGHNCVYQVG